MADERADERTADLVIDPDVDLHVTEQRSEWTSRRWVLPAASVGGMIGAAARFLVEQAMPQGGGWPTATFVVNVTGCFLLAVLMAVLAGMRRQGPLWRVFLGVGVLGGFTTFSTYSVQAAGQVTDGEPLLAATYLFGTVFAAAVAVLAGLLVGRRAIRTFGESSR